MISGKVDPDLQMLEIGPLCHARWLTLECQILHFYVSERRPTKTITLLVEFSVKIYFCSWFEIKQNNRITDGARNFFRMVKKTVNFTNEKVSDIALKVLKTNAYFAHPENVFSCMLADDVSKEATTVLDQLMERDLDKRSVCKLHVPDLDIKVNC